jgi:hypothetical protein
MMDLSREFAGDPERMSEIEALIAQRAKSRYDIAVKSVYWRLNEHVAVGQPGLTRAPVATPAARVEAEPPAYPMPTPMPAATAFKRRTDPRYDGGFPKCLKVGIPRQKRHCGRATDQDIEVLRMMACPRASSTQYGELN